MGDISLLFIPHKEDNYMATWPNDASVITKPNVEYIRCCDNIGCVRKIKPSDLNGEPGEKGETGDQGAWGSQGSQGSNGSGSKQNGEIFMSLLDSTPSGCAKCDGATVLRTTSLGTALANEGCLYGKGDGSTTVNTPKTPAVWDNIYAFIVL